jgi:hypothetical protein
MIGFASAVVIGLLLIVGSVHKRPQRAVYNGECVGVYVPGPEGEEVKPCDWLTGYSGPTDEDMHVGPDWRTLNLPEN